MAAELGTAHVVIVPTILTKEKVAAAFTEWERRYREEPERFMSEQQAHEDETADSYGDMCAPYFLAILTGQV